MRFRSEASTAEIEAWDLKDGNVPYRGGVVHMPGQEPPQHEPTFDITEVKDDNPLDDSKKVQELATYDEPEEKPTFVTPIPVDVFSLPNVHEFTQATLYQRPVDTTPVRIIGRNKGRTRAVIRNGAEVIYLSQSSNVGTTDGFVLAANTDLEITSQDEIYAISGTTVSVVSVLNEYAVRT